MDVIANGKRSAMNHTRTAADATSSAVDCRAHGYGKKAEDAEPGTRPRVIGEAWTRFTIRRGIVAAG
jgi:hypothetical protein